MAFGIQIENANGDIQIDGDFANFSIVQSGTSTINSTPSGEIQLAEHNITVNNPTDIAPMCFVKTGTNRTGLIYTAENNTDLQVTKLGFLSEDTSGLEYHLVNLIPNAPRSSGFGIEILDENGGVAFDDIDVYMKIIDMLAWELTTSLSDTEILNYASEPDPFYNISLMNNFHVDNYDDGGISIETRVHISTVRQFDNTTAVIEWTLFKDPPGTFEQAINRFTPDTFLLVGIPST